MREKYSEFKPLLHITLYPSYLQFLGLPSYFKQLCDGVDKPLEVMVTHLLNLPVMVSNTCIQLLHEEAMLPTIVHRPGIKQRQD